MRIHVIPVGDGDAPHVCSKRCWCFPLLASDGVTTHNAKDCRERYERAGHPVPGKPWALVQEDEG